MTETSFIPQFGRYPASISHHLMRIAKAQAVVETARILPAQEDILRVSALAETVHFSTLLEGNELSRIEAERALRHELDARGRAELELVNYVTALEHLESDDVRDAIRYDVPFVLNIHRLITRGLGRDGTSFEPRHEGAWRDGIAVVPDALGVIQHTGAPAGELEDRVTAVMRYLERNHGSTEYPGAILAGVVHHAITDLHPFADGNGRTARVMAFAVLLREGVLSRRLFSPDRHYALDRPAYLTALRSATRLGTDPTTWYAPGNLEPWLVYYTDGLATEYERTAKRVEGLNAVADRVNSSALQLTLTQEHMVSVLSAGDRTSISRREYQEIERLSEDQAQREIAALVSARLLAPTGTGRATRYRLPGTPSTRLQWTPETIEHALREFIAGHDQWPARQQFVDAGLGGLYIAMSRHGGVKSWAHRVGF